MSYDAEQTKAVMPPKNIEEAFSENLHSWDSISNLHAQGSGASFYRIDEFLNGECKLGPWEIDELGEVTGKELLHLQCHIGTDTLSWARRGAIVTGLDFSPKAIIEAKRFADILDIDDAKFVVSSVKDAAANLDNKKFDIIYTGRGAICWLPDLDEWASVCSTLIKPGGVLYFEETHPTLDLLDLVETKEGKFLSPQYNPFSKQPVSFEGQGSYADRNAATEITRCHCWDHGFGEIISSLISHGFKIELLNERYESFFMPFAEEMFEPTRPHYWKLKDEYVPFPMSFTLKATHGI